MSNLNKLIVTGVGGQGVTYTVRLLMNAAVLAGLKVDTDEIHGLSQRGGVVNAGITFGAQGHGYVDSGEADFMIGLEKLEAQRSAAFLKSSSRVVIDDTRVMPFSVNAGRQHYPESGKFIQSLRENIDEVIFISGNDEIKNKFRIYYVLGAACKLQGFPIPCEFLQQSIEQNARAKTVEESVRAFKLGNEYGSS